MMMMTTEDFTSTVDYCTTTTTATTIRYGNRDRAYKGTTQTPAGGSTSGTTTKRQNVCRAQDALSLLTLRALKCSSVHPGPHKTINPGSYLPTKGTPGTSKPEPICVTSHTAAAAAAWINAEQHVDPGTAFSPSASVVCVCVCPAAAARCNRIIRPIYTPTYHLKLPSLHTHAT